MPEGLLQLVLFIALLAPGIVFFTIYNAFKPERELSALKESAVVGLVGVLADVVTLLLLLLLRIWWRFPVPDVELLLTKPSEYVGANAALVWWFSLAYLGVACLVAVALAFGSLRLRAIGTISNYSAWYRLMHVPADAVVYCGCQMEDASWLGGYLYSFNTDVKETGDRELILRPPISYRAEGSDEVVELADVSAVTVSASRILFLQVSYLPAAQLQGLP